MAAHTALNTILRGAQVRAPQGERNAFVPGMTSEIASQALKMTIARYRLSYSSGSIAQADCS
jgi:hypothetical protein